jgi:hypothetical protein
MVKYLTDLTVTPLVYFHNILWSGKKTFLKKCRQVLRSDVERWNKAKGNSEFIYSVHDLMMISVAQTM